MAANKAAHAELLKVLNGGGKAVSTKSGVVTLNLHQLVNELAASLGVESQVSSVQSKLQGSSGASTKAKVQNKLGITVPSSSGQLVILRSNQLETAQDIANLVKHLAVVLPVLMGLLFALAVYLARGRRRLALRTSGWCLVLIGALLFLIRRAAGDAIVNDLVKLESNRAAAHDTWNIATSLLFDIAVAVTVLGLVIVVAAWLAGPTRPATAIRRFLAPEMRDSPVVVYASVGAAYLLVVAWGPTPAFRNVWSVVAFGALIAFGVTMYRREALLEFPAAADGTAMTSDGVAVAAAGSRAGAATSAATESPPPGDRVASLERLAALRDRGAITSEEYEHEKTHVIHNGA